MEVVYANHRNNSLSHIFHLLNVNLMSFSQAKSKINLNFPCAKEEHLYH
jgi:hypothetical protein